MNASIKEKEIATKNFLDRFEEYNFYQVCEVIGLNKGTYYHVQYTSIEFMPSLKTLKVKQSFSDPGEPYDNAVMESFLQLSKGKKYIAKIIVITRI